MDWNPIKTAPRGFGSSPVLLTVRRCGGLYVTVGWWEPDLNDSPSGGWTDGTVADWGMQYLTELAATRWAPLPKPAEE